MAICGADCVRHSPATVLALAETADPGPALASSPLKASAAIGHRTASLTHRVQGQTGSFAHNHGGRPHPIPIAFLLHGEKSPTVHITVAETNSAEMEGEMGKGSPLTLIRANDTAPAFHNNTPEEKQFLDA